MDFISIGARGAVAATLGVLVLAGCGPSEPPEPTPGEPVRVAECSALIRAQLDLPDTFQLRSATDERRSYRRSTRIIFAAHMARRSGPDVQTVADSGSVAVCQATCTVREDGQLEPRLGSITASGSGDAAMQACPARRLGATM